MRRTALPRLQQQLRQQRVEQVQRADIVDLQMAQRSLQ